MFHDLIQESTPGSVSDHFPIVSELSKVMWLGHHCFIPLVKEVWNSQSFEGWEGFKLIEKLKLIK